ncbi:MAG: cation:proton antiporter [archaeon]
MAIEFLVLQIGIVLFVSMLLGSFFSKIRQSSIIGYVLGGIILGPSVLGFVKETELLSLFSELGMLLLLFYIGIEINPKKFRKGGLIAIILGPAKMAICFSLGFLVALPFGFSLFESALIGVIISMSSTAIIGKYLIDNNKTNGMEASIAIPMLLVEDFVAIIIIAMLSAFGGTGTVKGVILNSLFFVIVGIFVISEFSKYLMRIMEKLDYERHIALYGVGIALGLAFLAQFFGLSPAIGAFLGGFLLSELKHAEKIREELHTFRDFFAVFFFTGIGLAFVLPKTFPELGFMFGAGLAVLAVYILGEWIAYGGMGALLGMKPKFTIYMANFMAPIGEFSLIIAGTAIALKLPHASGILNLAIFLGISSTIIMPFLVRNSDSIAEILGRIVPRQLKSAGNSVQKSLGWIGRGGSPSADVQNKFVEAMKNIGVNLFAVFAIVYLAGFAILNTPEGIAGGIKNIYVFAAISIALMVPAFLNIRKAVRIAVMEIAGTAGKGFFPEEWDERFIQAHLADVLLGLFLIAVAFVSVFIAHLLRALYWELPVVFAVAGTAYLLKAAISRKRKSVFFSKFAEKQQ